ncbi:hypothetical protein [Streptomyces caeruleatus]|uniref:Lipoprotein n=1 Tax=Streptomyces caeruleatus TaxID=661399 RepID=A0A101U6T0_9ACTN|nr:hypothetical protein [Streptomyces caeruleatus]KUO05085.1 hypothetical protein AQJ67_06730 [Streptomyces caeruleatus]
MTRTTLLPRAAVTLLLGVAAAAACTDNSPPAASTSPTPTAAPTSTPMTTTATPEPSAPSAPAVLTPDDTGRTVTLALGDTTQLRLPGRWRETAPIVDGTAVVLVPVDYETDPGFRAWDVRAAKEGEAVLRTPGQQGLRSLRITFQVG